MPDYEQLPASVPAPAQATAKVFSTFVTNERLSTIMFMTTTAMAIGYFLSAWFYGFNVGMSSSLNTTALVKPQYDLVGVVPSYVTAGLAKPSTLLSDAVYVSRDETNKATYYHVNIYDHTIGLISILTTLYGATAFYLAGKTKYNSILFVSKFSSVLYTVSLIIAWNVIHPDIMYILGNNDKIAHWLVSCGLVAQAGLYYATEHNMVVGAGLNIDAKVSGRDAQIRKTGISLMVKEFGFNLDVTQDATIMTLAFLVGTYLISVVVGVSILAPLNYLADFNLIAESYRYVIAFYLTMQFAEYFRFLAALFTPVMDPSKFKDFLAMFVSPWFAMFLHTWLFVLVALFAFFPRTIIAEAGLL